MFFIGRGTKTVMRNLKKYRQQLRGQRIGYIKVVEKIWICISTPKGGVLPFSKLADNWICSIG
jgi:hypothetical protein